MMTEVELINYVYSQDPTVTTLEDALEWHYLNGVPDESDGDVESPTGHFYRVDRWIVRTDERGFHDVETYDTEVDAEEAFERYDNEFSLWITNE